MTSARPGDVTAHLGEDVTFSSINASHSTGFLDYLFHFSFLFFFLFLVGGRGRGVTSQTRKKMTVISGIVSGAERNSCG